VFSSLIRRTTVVAVLATAAASLVSGVAVSAGPHTTSLSIRVAHQAVKPGGSDVVSGSLRVGSSQALPGKTVTLEARMAGDTEFLPVGTDITGPSGGVALMVTPAETTRYRWVFAGDEADRASHSGVARIKVRVPMHPANRLATSLSVRVARPVVDLAGNDTVSGRLTSRRKPLRRQIVVLLTRVDGATSWAFAGAKRTARNGGVAFGVHPSASARYRLLFQGTPSFRRARSGLVHVAIRSTALSITLSAAHVSRGGPATVGGVLTKSTAPYAGQAVQLWGKPAGSNKRFAALASAVSGPDGSVAFSVAPTRSMRYFLQFPRTGDAPAARSVTRTIAVS
jgi:hypothetical protein